MPNFSPTLADLRRRVVSCGQCALAQSKTQVVFGEGNTSAELMFVGEAPGEVEDQTGRPFVGPAGQLLTKILESAGINREEVYITNVVKCRPPGNRAPTKEEMARCWEWLAAQIGLIRPKIIVTLGNISTHWLLGRTDGINELRGRFFPWKGGIEIFPMFHPSYLLRNPDSKKGGPKYLTWQDIQAVKKKLLSLHSQTQPSLG